MQTGIVWTGDSLCLGFHLIRVPPPQPGAGSCGHQGSPNPKHWAPPCKLGRPATSTVCPGQPLAASGPPAGCHVDSPSLEASAPQNRSFYSALWEAGVDVELFICWYKCSENMTSNRAYRKAY